MNMFRLWRLFHRSGTRGTSGRTSALAIVAFASATAVFLTVLGGLHGFIWRASADHTFGCMIDSNRCAPGTYETWSKALAHADKLVATVGDGHWTADQATAVMNTYSDGYVMLAAFASLLLIVPFVALAICLHSFLVIFFGQLEIERTLIDISQTAINAGNIVFVIHAGNTFFCFFIS